MRIFFASDHAGFELKKALIPFVKKLGFEVFDKGAFKYDESDDYPDFIKLVAQEVSNNPQKSLGIVIGGSGQGEAIVSNKFRHVRAVVFNGQPQGKGGKKVPDEILLTREHNDANVLSLGARFITEKEAKHAVKEWLTTQFSLAPRHKRRLIEIDKIEHELDSR